MILAERSARVAAEAKAEEAGAARRILDIEIERLKLEIARLRREKYGPSSERAARIEQLELSLEALEETAAEASAAAEAQEPETEVRAFTRRKPARRPLPEHLPRKRIVYPVASSCACCGGELRKLGEDVTETLERVPASWFVIEHVREKMTCRRCEAITQPPAPFHPISRGRAGPNLLAEVVFGKFGLHLPLHRQSERFSREGVPIDVSTLADWVGAVTVALRPLTEAIEAHVRTAARLHADDTPVPVLARGKTRIGRLWTVVRDDHPFGGPDPPAAHTSTRQTGAANTRRASSATSPASCRPTRTPASDGCTSTAASAGRCGRLPAGRMLGGTSSSWPWRRRRWRSRR
jgi:transposase